VQTAGAAKVPITWPAIHDNLAVFDPAATTVARTSLGFPGLQGMAGSADQERFISWGLTHLGPPLVQAGGFR